MKLKRLLEEYLNTIKYKKRAFEIFVNPTKNEMLEASKTLYGKEYIRFVADPKKKKVYVFDPTLFHDDAIEKIGKNLLPNVSLWGTAEKRGGSWIMEGSDTFHENEYELRKFKWNWLEKYISIEDFIYNKGYLRSVHPRDWK